MTWRMRIACAVPKATNTPSEYVINIAFPRERTPVLRYTRTVSFVYFSYTF
jgi:hypothetical protein